MSFLDDVQMAITAAETEGPVTPPEVRAALTGLSGGKLIGALQRLARLFEGDDKKCYLEIGVFRGLSLLSVASAAPRLTCYGVDNFQPLDRDQNDENYDLVLGNIAKFGLDNIDILNADFEVALANFDRSSGGKKIGLLFIDGPHDYRSQIVCLLFAKQILAPDCVIIVDDSNYNHVRQANRDFLISHPDFKLMFEAYTNLHPGNQSLAERDASEADWWNGANIMVRDREDALEAILPPVIEDKTVFVNDHLIHADRYAQLAPEALGIYAGLAPWRLPFTLLRLYRTRGRYSDPRNSEHLTLNTYSRGLPRRIASRRDAAI